MQEACQRNNKLIINTSFKTALYENEHLFAYRRTVYPIFGYLCQMNPKLSILIPYYGTASRELLNRCLDSIRQQGMEESAYEIILADDNGNGTGAARNQGIRQAQGEYLLFVDADDYLFPKTLSVCLLLLETQKPDVLTFGFKEVTTDSERITSGKQATIASDKQAITSGKQTTIAPDKQTIAQSKQTKINRHHLYPSGAAYMLFHNFRGVVWQHLIRRELLTTYSLSFAEGCYIEDEEFVAKLYFHAGKTLIMDWLVYAYYQSPHSIMHHPDTSQRMKRIQDFRQALERLRNYLHTQTEASTLQREALERRIHFLTIDYLRQLLRNRCSTRHIFQELKALKRSEFLPLPKRSYSWKYTLARMGINLLVRL